MDYYILKIDSVHYHIKRDSVHYYIKIDSVHYYIKIDFSQHYIIRKYFKIRSVFDYCIQNRFWPTLYNKKIFQNKISFCIIFVS